MNTYLIAAGILVILALAAYAGYLHWLLYRRRRQARGRADSGVESYSPGEGDRNRVATGKGVYLLAEAILDDKLTHTEGCLRICAIAPSLDDYSRFREEFGVFFRVAEATAHIPILDDWRALDAGEQRVFDRERRGVEERYGDAVVEAAERLIEEYRSGR